MGLRWAELGFSFQGSFESEREIGLVENGKVSLHRKNELPHTATSNFYLFLS